MNQMKIGKFILELRKEKNMTQQDLANLLNVTDRAISNWENGRRMPDISFFKPLCEILEISISELLSGERIEESLRKEVTEDTIIQTLHANEKGKKKNRYMVCFSIAIIILLLILLFISYKQSYPKINPYYLVVSLSDEESEKMKSVSIKSNQIYYYGIQTAQICDFKDNCFELKSALEHHQTTIPKLKQYLESQFSLGNLDRIGLYDGGTLIYQNERYSAIICNTIDGNQDIYFGESDMIEALDGEYCGHKKIIQEFIRTYHIVSVTELDKEFSQVTLKSGEQIEQVTINNSYEIIPGREYQFTFYTFQEFEDTISNIFNFSTLVKTKETEEAINTPVVVNQNFEEPQNISMKIENHTKTDASIVITDYSGFDYTYGEEFKIEKLENGIWKEVEKTGINYGFNAMGYHIDINHQIRMYQNWNYIYKPLTKGEYRIVKEVNKMPLYAYFKID